MIVPNRICDSFRATFFLQGGAAGACGKVHSDSDLIVALGEAPCFCADPARELNGYLIFFRLRQISTIIVWQTGEDHQYQQQEDRHGHCCR